MRRKLIDEGNLKRYVPYAIGEIFLVVVGILIALQINNWNENRKERVIENKLLLELVDNLEINLTRLKNEIVLEQKAIAEIDLVVDYIDHNRPYHDSMDVHFRNAFRAHDIVLSSSAFESIKSKGFELIHEDSLRKLIIELFDVTYANMISNTVRLEDQFWPASVLPLWHRHFRSSIDGNALKPVNYEALLADTEYTNTLLNRRVFREVATEAKTECIVNTEKVLSTIRNHFREN